MTIYISSELLGEIHAHGKAHYPEEGAGLLIGTFDGVHKRVTRLMMFVNARETSARHNRYLLTPQDYLRGEQEAARFGLDVIGVFHSHPDHPDRPSEFDREWAMPVLSYIITSVQSGQASSSRSWLLSEDRLQFDQETIAVEAQPIQSTPNQGVSLNMPTLRIPTPLRAYTGGEREINLQGGTVNDALNDLIQKHPALQAHIFTDEGSLRPFINLFIGEEHINDINGMETSLAEDDRLLLLPSIAGG